MIDGRCRLREWQSQANCVVAGFKRCWPIHFMRFLKSIGADKDRSYVHHDFTMYGSVGNPVLAPISHAYHANACESCGGV